MTPFTFGLGLLGLVLVLILVIGYAAIRVGHTPEEK
jgi:hypothetical protein